MSEWSDAGAVILRPAGFFADGRGVGSCAPPPVSSTTASVSSIAPLMHQMQQPARKQRSASTRENASDATASPFADRARVR